MKTVSVYRYLSENEQTQPDPEKWCEERGFLALIYS